jgi:hypothetical protein
MLFMPSQPADQSQGASAVPQVGSAANPLIDRRVDGDWSPIEFK